VLVLPQPSRLVFGNIELCPGERRLLIDGRPVVLGSRAFDLLLVLIERRDRVVGKDELMLTAWPGVVVEENNLTVQVSNLRKLLGRDAISTITGRGYRFTLAEGAVAEADQGAAREPARADRRPPGNLPVSAPALFGRDDDVRRVVQSCLATPLVTLCGAGGIGKTSVASVVAHQLAPRFAHGAWVIELAAVLDPALVVSAVAQCLGVALPGRSAPENELAGALRERELFLVFDNCEHLLAPLAQLVHAIARGAAGVRMLATSQAPLNVPGEAVFRLAPLALPPPGDLAHATSFGAVQLFVERVRAQGIDLELSDHDLAEVVDICRQLDGIALAIELAAARVPLLGIDGVHSRLGERLRMLTAGPRVAAQRHQTLRAALAWSHQLLRPASQVGLRRLGVFAGSFSFEAARRLVGEADGVAIDIFELLAELVDRSLLVTEDGVRRRYRMLESMRAFALSELDAAGELDAWRRRHAHVMRDICLEAVRLRDSAWLWAEMSNVRTALSWAVAVPGEGAVAVALATHTAVVLATAGPVPEAMRNLLRVQELIDDSTPLPTRAQYWQWLGRFGIDGRLPTSRCIEALTRAAAMFETLRNPRHLHACRRMMAEAHLRAGDLDAAQAQLEAAEALETPDGPSADRMRRLRVSALLADAAGRPAQALRLAQCALDIAEATGVERYSVMLMADMAWTQLHAGEPEDAVSRLGTLLRRIERGGREGLTRAHALAGLTAALVACGRLAQACAGARTTIDALRQSGIFLARGDVFAWLAAAAGHPEVAAQLLGATELFHARGETRRDRICQHAREQAQARIACALPPAEAEFWSRQGETAEEPVLASILVRALEDAAADGA
jgi:predicted ATPase/DNA-binding winged helix-turn-helix (wHTH) protein